MDDLQEDSASEDCISTCKEEDPIPKKRNISFGKIARHEADYDQTLCPAVIRQEPATKKRKYAAQKQDQSLKSVVKGSATNIIPESAHKSNTKQKNEGQPALQFTMPNSLKQPKESDLLFNVNAQMKQKFLFRNATITKSSRSSDKGSVRELPKQSLIRHKQVTTTEQRLSLSKFTIEKLAAFTFIPKASNQIPMPRHTSTDVRHKETCLPSNSQVCPNQAQLSSRHGSSSCCNNSTHEIMRNSALDGEPDSINDPFANCKDNGDDHGASRGPHANNLYNNVDVEIGDISRETFKALHTNNTFDKDLDGDDLLEPTRTNRTPVILELPVQKIGGKTTSSPNLSILQVAVNTYSNPRYNRPVLAVNESEDEIGTGGCIISSTANLEADDEFCIDEDVEAELLNLAHTTASAEFSTITERYASSTIAHGSIGTMSQGSDIFGNAFELSSIFLAPSGPPSLTGTQQPKDRSTQSPIGMVNLEPPLGNDEEDWGFVQPRQPDLLKDRTRKVASSLSVLLPKVASVSTNIRNHAAANRKSSDPVRPGADGRYEREELKPFARPAFPNVIPDRSPVVGLSARSFLRVCFRIGEMYREGARCNALGIDAIIELFARVGFSSREPSSIKQHFQFLDLWHDRPPLAAGILANYKSTSLAEGESKIFLEGPSGKMVRCLGRLKRNARHHMGWILNIINIRETDWEEIIWTRRIVSGDHSMSHKEDSNP